MSREVSLGTLRIHLDLKEQAEQTKKDLKEVANEMDKTADAAVELADETSTLGDKLDTAATSLQRTSQMLMGMADIVESGSRIIEEYGTELGLTEEQVVKLTGTLENIQKPLMIGAQLLMGLGDALEFAKFAHESLKISMLTNPITLVLIAIAAAVTMLYMAWHFNWGGMRDTFDRIWKHMQPLFDAIKRVLGKLGIDTGSLGEIWEKVWRAIGWVLETILIPMIDALIILVEWIEKAIDAWNAFWGTQQEKPLASGPNMSGGSGGGTNVNTTYHTESTTVYGGVNAYGGTGTTEEGMNAMQIYQASRTGAGGG